MATLPPVSLREEAEKMTLVVKIIHVKRTRIRLFIFGALIKLAAIICPTTIEITEATEAA